MVGNVDNESYATQLTVLEHLPNRESCIQEVVRSLFRTGHTERRVSNLTKDLGNKYSHGVYRTDQIMDVCINVKSANQITVAS